mgnify:CR=1 FL=1
MTLTVAIIGASQKPQRYAYKTQALLMEKKHTVFPVSANGLDILGVQGYASIRDIRQPIDTVTLYLNAGRHEQIKEEILQARPRRIIFNPGTESAMLVQFYQARGIETLEACTLIMLSSGCFD